MASQLTATQWIQWEKLGDINADGYIDNRDYALLTAAYGSVPGQPNWNPAADLNNDGKVDLADLVILAQHINTNIWDYYGVPKPISPYLYVGIGIAAVAAVAGGAYYVLKRRR